MAVATIGFDALGKRFSLKFGFGALCALEDEYDLPFVSIVQKVFPELGAADVLDPEKLMAAQAQVRCTDLRSLLRAGIEPAVTESEVEDIVDEIGLDAAALLLKRAMTHDAGGGEEGKNPPSGRRKR